MFEMLFLEDCAVSPFPQKLRDLFPTYLSIFQGILSEIPPSIKEEEVRIFVKEKLGKLLPRDPHYCSLQAKTALHSLFHLALFGAIALHRLAPITLSPFQRYPAT
ncbi:hypothetical protein TNCV_1499181 [Trichonephila clavipes]|nr:hypothetical protein TNCV_1499181 [Trichonephila clavipes]